MEVTAGNFDAKIVDYALTLTKGGDMQLGVMFEFEQEGVSKTLSYFGSFKAGRAREITLETMEKMGFNGQSLAGLSDGPASGILDTDKDYSIKIEMDTYEGKTTPKIRWVNLPNEGGFAKRLTLEEIIEKETGMNLAGDLVAKFGTQTASIKENDLPF